MAVVESIKAKANPGVPEKPVALLRQLGIVSATALVVSNMIGVGIFGSTGYLAGQLGDVGLVLLIWAVGAVCALAGALCYSELGINFPSSGGEYVYLTRGFGPTWGFMTGWVSFFAGFSAPVAAAALVFSNYLGYFFPSLKPENAAFVVGAEPYTLRLGGAQLVACALIALFTLINFFGVRRVARLQNFLTITKVLVLVAFIGFGLTMGSGSWEHLSETTERTTTSPLAAQFAVSLFFIYVAYSGWNAATYVAEELKQPSRTLPIALATGTLLVAILYIGLNVVFIYATPLEEMKLAASRQDYAVGANAARSLFGAGIAGVFSALMALSLVSTVNAMVTIGPRVYYAMAKNGAFFAAAGKVSRRWRTPVIAIVCQGVCAMLMTATPFPDLLIYIGFTLNFFAVMGVASLFIFRRREGWRKLRVVSFAWPVTPLLFLLVGGWMIVFGMTLKPLASLAAILTVVTGAAVYHFWLRPAAQS
ncbi:MAG: amino acid permease [bacterium]|nr:amino acid permease [bacterium]